MTEVWHSYSADIVPYAEPQCVSWCMCQNLCLDLIGIWNVHWLASRLMIGVVDWPVPMATMPSRAVSFSLSWQLFCYEL
jgi:hypothetical protein